MNPGLNTHRRDLASPHPQQRSVQPPVGNRDREGYLVGFGSKCVGGKFSGSFRLSHLSHAGLIDFPSVEA